MTFNSFLIDEPKRDPQTGRKLRGQHVAPHRTDPVKIWFFIVLGILIVTVSFVGTAFVTGALSFA